MALFLTFRIRPKSLLTITSLQLAALPAPG